MRCAGELRRFDRYLAQHQFLLEHKITDSAALCAYRAQTETEIGRMVRQRAALYRKRGDTSNGMNRAELSAQIDRLTSALRAMRRELRLCEQIEGGYGAYPGPACIGPYGRAAGRNEKSERR